MMSRQYLPIAILLLFLGYMPSFVLAQPALLEDRWRSLETPHFVIYSQVSAGRTERFARNLETWRRAAAYIISDSEDLPGAAVENRVFLFKNLESFQVFALANEVAFFYPTPRRNFMAVVFDDEQSLVQARHHYIHFLIRNFTDLRIPRWYEEGLSGYLSNLQVNRKRVELKPYSQQAFEVATIASREVSLEDLFFDEQALGSPRLIQLANHKSETFLHFLLHAHEEDGFSDRRTQLERYIELLLAGRSQRFAFDQAFDGTTAQLDTEFARYLGESSRGQGELDIADLVGAGVGADYRAEAVDFFVLANVLGELAINSGKFKLAESFFAEAIDRGAALPRSYSGLADALRMQEGIDVSDKTLTNYYRRAISLAPENPVSFLDYGEYLETVLGDCGLVLSPALRASTQDEIEYQFHKAIELAPDSAEANLAMAQLYLLAGNDYQEGLVYQVKALELLPADTFIMEQTIKYKIESKEFKEAQRLINELSQPLHFWQEFAWVTDLRRQLTHKQKGIEYNACEHGV